MPKCVMDLINMIGVLQEFSTAHSRKDEEAFVQSLRDLIERRGPNQVREIAEAVRQIGKMELTDMTSSLMGAKDAAAYNAFGG